MGSTKFPAPPLGGLQPSATLVITSEAKAMEAAGENVVNLSAGEPDFDTPAHISKAAIEALKEGDTKYTPVAGRPELREAVAEKLNRENGIACGAENIVAAPGAKYSVFTAIAVLCGQGDKVIIPRPFWLSYAAMVKAAGAEPVFVDTKAENNFCMTRKDLEAALCSDVKALILNTPSNPTGGVYKRQRLEALAEAAVKADIMVISDEIYEKLVYDSNLSHTSIASLSEEAAAHTITVNGFSKAYSMTGWRLGYMAAPDWVVSRAKALQSHTTSNPVSFAQAGAVVALNSSQDCVEHMRQAFAERRDRIYQRLREIEGLCVFKPRGAFYIFPDISAFGVDAMTFARRLLNEEKLAVIPGTPFGAPEHIRLSYACSMDVIEEGCDRLARFCGKLG